MTRLQIWLGIGISLFGMLAARPVPADTIELTNGDVLSGHVVSLDGEQLILKSDVLGELKLAREKVSAIHLGDQPVRNRPAARAAQTAPAQEKPALDPAVQKVLDSAPSSDEVLKQLRGGGVNPQTIGALQSKFPLLNTPEASGYFNDTLTGLMTGQMDIQDIRKDAVKARDQLKDLQEELGPEGAALNGYMSILNKFIRETEPPPSTKKPAEKKSQPKKKTPATFPPKP